MTSITRFPPEPNGYLHIGHCKSLMINYAEGNLCHLRLDDTNPSAEKKEFVNEIINDMLWLGYNPGNITYTSDYFDKLYEFACLLIKNGNAYVDFSKPEIIKDERHNGIENKYRIESCETNLMEFENMKNKKYIPGEAVLRLKIDMKNNNHTLRDPIAYRIDFTPHFKTNETWCIYPSYDYSHGIIDAIENITNSYCTDEFYIRRDLYYWSVNILNKLGCNLNPANVHEYGKLNIENNTLSKRNIKKLIENNVVSGYDDPSLLTVRGMRTRGYTPEIIKSIANCSGLGKVTTTVSMKFIYHSLIMHYNPIAIRCFAVINPIKCVIENLSENYEMDCNHPHIPNKPEFYHTTKITNEIFIEKDDFKLEHDNDFYRLSPKNEKVRLKFFDIVKYVKFENNIIYIDTCNIKRDKKVKSTIHWISSKHAIPAKFEFIDEINPLLKNTFDGYIEKYVLDLIELDENTIFEFERIGYFKLLKKDVNNLLYFLCIVILK